MTPETTREGAPPAEPPGGATSAGPKRPPVLASEVLLEEVAPSAPGRGAERVAAALVGLLGVALELGVCTLVGRSPSWLLLAAFGSFLLIGLLPVAYVVRAGVVFAVGAGLGAVTLVGAADPGAAGVVRAILLAALAVTLPAGLLVRSNYCGSRVGRGLTALGIVLAVAWLAALGTSGLAAGFDGRGGAPALGAAAARVLLALVCLLALLAFMSPASTGGCRAWATLVLAWFPVQLGLDLWAQEPAWSQTLGWVASSRAAAVLLLVPASVALSHLLGAGISTRTREKAERGQRLREAVLQEAKRSVLEVRRARAERIEPPVARENVG